MGAVFDIYLELKNDPNKDEIVRWTKLFIEEYSKYATFDVDREGKTEFEKAMKIIFTDRFDHAYEESELGKYVPKPGCYMADFDARYGWHTVMEEWFKRLAPILGEGTELDIWSDDGDTHCIVKEGRAFLTYKFD